MTKTPTYALLALLTLGVCSAQAQDAPKKEPEAKYFHLNFVLKELDEGKVVNSRAYSTVISTNARAGGCNVRSGDKVRRPQNSEIDVGVSFDCGPFEEVGNSLVIRLTAELSTLAATTENGSDIIRQNKWSSSVIVPIGKPSVVYSSEDLMSKHKMEIELTVTPIAP
jgi:hypothetical protein